MMGRRTTSGKKRPTQADVARRANVSQALVSYVLNDTLRVSVPSETRQRILDAMAELGYVPNLTARSLRTNKTYTIAGIIPDITNPSYPGYLYPSHQHRPDHSVTSIVDVNRRLAR